MSRCGMQQKLGLRTAWVGTITRERGLDALVAGLLGGCRAGCGGRALSATAGGGVGEWLFVGVTFIDVAGKKVART
jgi:hypothetical protein